MISPLQLAIRNEQLTMDFQFSFSNFTATNRESLIVNSSIMANGKLIIEAGGRSG